MLQSLRVQSIDPDISTTSSVGAQQHFSWLSSVECRVARGASVKTFVCLFV